MPKLFLLLCLVAPITLMADTLTLKNGDRLTGKIVKADEKEYVIATEFAGTITVKAEAVATVKADDPVAVTTKGGQVLKGPLDEGTDAVKVATKESGDVTLKRVDVATIRSQAEQAKYEAEIDRFRNPGLLDLWGGFFDLGYAKAGGNARANTFTLGANAVRATTRDKITANFASVRSSGLDRATGKDVRTANATRGGLQYDLNINKKVFAFALTTLETDEFQNLDLRWVGGGGLGYNLRKSDNEQLSFNVGGSVNREFFSTGLNRTSGEIILGQQWRKKFTDRFSVQENFSFFPNLSRTGAFRSNFDVTGVTKIAKWLNWQVSFSDRYLSNPLPTFEKNDTLFTTGVRVTFQK